MPGSCFRDQAARAGLLAAWVIRCVFFWNSENSSPKSQNQLVRSFVVKVSVVVFPSFGVCVNSFLSTIIGLLGIIINPS